MQKAIKKINLNLLIVLTIVITGISPATTYSQNNSNESSNIPTWAKVTFWGAFGIVLAKVFIYDEYYGSGENENSHRFSQKDSSANAIKYVLDDKQQSKFDSLKTKQEKADFLNNFWKNLEHQPNTNDLRREFEMRYFFADSAFQLPYKKGWKTDRGRIHILYGKPDEMLIQPFTANPFLTTNSKKYSDLEIWYYNTPGGQNTIPIYLRSYDTGQMFFVFCRRQGHAEYEQIFSTELGEKTDAGLYGPGTNVD